MIYDVIVIGAGASGLYFSSLCDDKNVLVIERNAIPGKKLNITGKGRCNITNSKGIDDFYKEVFTNPKFLISAFSEHNNVDVEKYFNTLGVTTKEERGGRIFPKSDKASDVTQALYKAAKCEFRFREKALRITKKADTFNVITEKNSYNSHRVVVATGGASYPLTGSDGSGYKLLESLGHTITELKPALVGLELNCKYKNELMGVSLKNVSVTLRTAKKLYSEFGEMLFTHYGVSGPVILRLSPYVCKSSSLSVDLKPAITDEQLYNRIQRDFNDNKTKKLKNSLNKLLIMSLIKPIIDYAGLDGDKRVDYIDKSERLKLVDAIKHFTFEIKGRRRFEEAVITDGGVKVDEINPKTMESKLTKGLYVVGEVLDVAANTGGYNLQIAFSTAYKAYNSIRREL